MFIDVLKDMLEEYELVENTKQNVNDVYNLLISNEYFIKNTQSENMTIEDCIEDIKAVPPGKDLDSKSYVSLYKDNKCICIIDFIVNYPQEKTGYIGLFILDNDIHGTGLGTSILNQLTSACIHFGLKRIELGCYKTNEIGFSFWSKKGFQEIKRTIKDIEGIRTEIINMRKDL